MWFSKFLILFFSCGSVFSYGAIPNVIEESEIDSSLSENIVVYGLISELRYQNTNISAVCATDLTNVLRSINKQDMWAVKVMDASGTYESSFVWGQNAWLGSKRHCDFLNTPPKLTLAPDVPKLMDKNLISTLPPMEMDFKMIFMIIVSPYKIDPMIHLKTSNTHRLSVCLPKSCSNYEIESLSKAFFAHRKLKFQTLYNATIEVIKVRNMDINNFLQRPEVSGIFCTICLVTTLVVIFSFTNKCVEHTNMDGVKRFLKCFSIYDNVISIYDTSSSPNAINSINGIRTIICIWVLSIHCGYFAMYAYDNLPAMFTAFERIELQPFFAILFYVDVFFVLSGLLLVFNFLKDERTLSEVRNSSYTSNVKLFAKKIIHRYIRLTPAFLFVIGISHILAVYIQESSSFYIDETFDTYCTKEAWWNSVFYIHNLFEVKDMCISWSWYLACDMQFYIIILFILFVHVRYPTLVKALFLALFVAMTTIGIYSNVEMNLLPSIDSIMHHLGEFYSEPWNRMHPYLAGATVGYIKFQMKGKTFPKSVTIPYWIFTAATLFVSSFLTALKDTNNLNFALALSFGRYLMGLFIGSIVFMCHFGYGGIANEILSSRFFVHLNKTTYIIYLIHPTIIMFLNSNQESSPHFDVASMTTLASGIMLISYIAAVVISPIFEIPFQKLSDEYVMKKSKTKN